MNICVGSYKTYITRKAGLILVVKNKENTPVCCIELEVGYYVNQVKLNKNQRLTDKDDKLSKFILQWLDVNKKSLVYQNCYDLRGIISFPSEPQFIKVRENQVREFMFG
jgi:hypothetical protein